MIIEKLIELLAEETELEQKLEKVVIEIVNQCDKLTSKEIESCDYDTLRKLYKAIHYRLDKEQRRMISNILITKKIEKYPQMLKPTYYPEIDQLNISESEKLRLDKAARNHHLRQLSEDDFSCLEPPLTISDLELLITIDVAQRIYDFNCPYCNCFCKIIKQKTLDRHKRVWELNALRTTQGGLTQEQEQELETLEEDGAGYIYLSCPEDKEFEYRITNMEQFQKFKNNISILYEIYKEPDLTYEKL